VGGGGGQLKSIIGGGDLDNWSTELFLQSRQDKEEKDGGFEDARGLNPAVVRIQTSYSEIRIRILPSPSKNGKKNLYIYCIVTSYYDILYLKNEVSVPSKSNKQRN
jgi:hypothetical protein